MKNFENIEDFVFSTPLYSPQLLAGNIPAVMKMLGERFRVDGFCPWCKSTSTFRVANEVRPGIANMIEEKGSADVSSSFFIIEPVCARNNDHTIKIWTRIADGAICKFGQSPSTADIIQAEVQRFTKVLDRQDAAEFNRAIGLAAHHIGIGSFVYLRRIFERMIERRYNEVEDKLGVDRETFQKARMDEKITILRDHLPGFLVENKKIYGFLSLGIHGLNEEECLGMFDVLRLSIEAILEEDEAARQIAAKRSELKKALGDLQPQQAEKSAGDGD